MRSIQFVQVLPEEFQKDILEAIKIELEQLKKEFQPKQPEEYLTRDEVKNLLKVNMSTVHNWTKAGKIKAYHLGNRVYYRRREIEQKLT